MALTVLTIPRRLTERDRARDLVRGSVREGTEQVVVNAFDQEFVARSAADEIVKQLLEVDVERVIVVNATPEFQRSLSASHRRRTRPGSNTFLLQFQTRNEDILLRQA